MPRDLRIFWAGMAIYVISFFLFAAGTAPPASPLPGFLCAYFAIGLPLDELRTGFHSSIFEDTPLEATCLLISGLVNPVFLAAAFFKLSGVTPRRAAVLKVLVLVMLPFSCAFFAINRLRFHPREGYYLWLAGVLTVLLSEQFARRTAHVTASRS